MGFTESQGGQACPGDLADLNAVQVYLVRRAQETFLGASRLKLLEKRAICFSNFDVILGPNIIFEGI